jgi:hypothetical protein
MKDSDIEDLLRNYRPVAPPVALRHRILATAHVPRIWPWASAAAALLVLGVTFQLATRSEAASAEMHFGPSASASVTDNLTDMLGGDRRARALAEFIVVAQQVRSERASLTMDRARTAEGARP